MFEFAARRVDAGLLTPTVAVCYGGELDELRALPGYTPLRDACGANNIAMFARVMSITGMVNVGKGAVVVGFAAEAHAFGKPCSAPPPTPCQHRPTPPSLQQHPPNPPPQPPPP